MEGGCKEFQVKLTGFRNADASPAMLVFASDKRTKSLYRFKTVYLEATQSLHHFKKGCLEAQQSLHGFKRVVMGCMELHHNHHMWGI
jgi:hypothetical protein